MKVAVFSGSFNPMHVGHLSILRYLTQEMDFDAVYLIVSPKNPLKDSISEDTGRARFEAAVAAVARYPELNVRVDDIELTMPAPQYTIRTLDELQRREPQNSFTLVIGGDNLADIRRWREYKWILTDYGVAVYPRTGVSVEAVRDELMRECEKENLAGESKRKYKIQLMADAPIVDVSSTQLREAIAAGEDVSALLM